MLKRSGTHFRAFFGDVANVDVNRDAEGLYTVPRSWKHFGTILEWMRDGACEMPTAYVPKSYDNRKASSEEVRAQEGETRAPSCLCVIMPPILPIHAPNACLFRPCPLVVAAQEELHEFVREAGYYGIRPLVEQAMPRLLKLRYGDNKQMLALLQAKGIA